MRTFLFRLSAAALVLTAGIPSGLARVYPREFTFTIPDAASAGTPMTEPATDAGADDAGTPARDEAEGIFVVAGYPDGMLTREQFVSAVATRLYDTRTLDNCFVTISSTPQVTFTLLFTDVRLTSPHAKAICAGMHNGWIRGNPDGSFRPHEPITQAEAVTILSRVSARVAYQLRPSLRGEPWYQATLEAFHAVTGVTIPRPGNIMTGTQLKSWMCDLSDDSHLNLDPFMTECPSA